MLRSSESHCHILNCLFVYIFFNDQPEKYKKIKNTCRIKKNSIGNKKSIFTVNLSFATSKLHYVFLEPLIFPREKDKSSLSISLSLRLLSRQSERSQKSPNDRSSKVARDLEASPIRRRPLIPCHFYFYLFFSPLEKKISRVKGKNKRKKRG